MDQSLPAEDLAWTGERLVTSCHRPLVYEHLHRYAVAFGLGKRKRVLDIACGEGYGANLLAFVASKVVGVDLDAGTIAHAKAKYRRRNLHFVQGSCTEIPCEDQSIDLVASFETIEHISEHDAFLSEIKRVLAPGGILVISSPHKAEYQKVSEAANPFHEAELDHDEFVQLITKRFKHCVAAKQRLVIGSWIAPDEPSAQVSTATFRGWFDGIDIESGVYRGLYSIAICSDQALPVFDLGMFENLRYSADTWSLLDICDEPAQELQTLKRNAQAQSDASTTLQGQLTASEVQLRQLTDELARKNEELSKTHGKLSVYVAQASQQTEQHKHSQKLNEEEVARARQYQKRLEGAIEKDKQYQSILEKDIALLTNKLEASTKKDKDAREQVRLYSIQLRQQTDRMSEMCASLPAAADKASVDSKGKASLIAFPHQVPVSRDMGVTEITWNTGDGSEGELYVSKDGEAEKCFVTGPRGSKQVPWILAGSSYEFRLYAGTEHKRLLNEVRVSGIKIPPPESRDIVRGFLDAPVEDVSATPHLEITGWAYSREAPISWVEAFLGDVPLGLLRYGEPRYDVTTDSTSPPSAECGFSGRFPLDKLLVRPTSLLVRVADERGNIQDFRTVTSGQPRSEPVAGISADAATLPSRDILSASKSALLSLAQISLGSFLASNSTVDIPSNEMPEISIILVLYNRAELTLQCLYSILRSNIDSYEVVIVDNASTDETPPLETDKRRPDCPE